MNLKLSIQSMFTRSKRQKAGIIIYYSDDDEGGREEEDIAQTILIPLSSL